MKSITKIVSDALFDDEAIDKELVEHYKKHPEELDLLVNKGFFNAIFLATFFIIGIALSAAAKILQFVFKDASGSFVSSVLLELVSEVGIAIFGGVIVAYLIDSLQKRQYQKNLKYRRMVKAAMEAEKVAKNKDNSTRET